MREHQTKATLSRHNLAILIEDQGQLDESEKIHRLNLKFWEGLAASEPSNADYRSKVALTLESLAVLLEKTAATRAPTRCSAARPSQRSSITKDFPNTPYHFGRLAGSLSGLAKLATARGDTHGSPPGCWSESLVARRAALALAPGNAGVRQVVATGCAELIETLIRLKDHQAASKIAVELRFALLRIQGKNPFAPARSCRDASRWQRPIQSSPRLDAPSWRKSTPIRRWRWFAKR